MNAPHALLRNWPADPRDALPLALWDAAAIEAATGGRASHAFQASGVEMDSRDVRPGDVFLALKGEAMDWSQVHLRRLCQGRSRRDYRSPGRFSPCAGCGYDRGTPRSGTCSAQPWRSGAHWRHRFCRENLA